MKKGWRTSEFVVFGLRMLEGRASKFESFEADTGCRRSTTWWANRLALAVFRGRILVESDANRAFRLTRKGLLVSDSIWPNLL